MREPPSVGLQAKNPFTSSWLLNLANEFIFNVCFL